MSVKGVLWLSFCVGFVLVPTAAAGIVQNPSPRLTYAPAEPQDLIGNLTWSDGGQIKWAPPWESQDLTGATDAAAWAPGVDRHYAAPDLMPKPLTFTSDPLPVDAELNVSREIEVTLMVRPKGDTGFHDGCNWVGGQNRAGYEIRLFAGDRFLGGMAEGHDYDRWPSDRRQPIDGFNQCHYLIHPEFGVLRAGEVLRLEVLRVRESLCNVPFANAPYPCGEYDIGLSGGHRSFIRLPLYNELDRALRTAEIETHAAGGPTDPSSDPASDEDPTAAQAFAPLAIPMVALSLGLGPRRRACALMLLLILSGGCIGNSPSKASAAPHDPRLEASHEPIGAVDGNASLVGDVRDVFGLPVADAHVMLLGRSNSTNTDTLGRFLFGGLAPGTARLRIDRSGFESFEGDVALIKGQITRVRIEMMQLGLSEEAGLRPHFHDYWGEKQNITVFEGEVDGAYFEIPENPGHDDLILPGTADVEIRVTWDAAGFRGKRVGLMFQTNQDAGGDTLDRGNFSMMAPRASGAPFHITSNWDMTDNGHAPSSLWAFRLYVMPYDLPRTTEKGPGDIQQEVLPDVPPFTVSIRIHKGVMPLERPHPDHWRGGTSIIIMDRVPKTGAKSTQDYPVLAPKVVPSDTQELVVQLVQNASTYPFSGLKLTYKSGQYLVEDECYYVIRGNWQGSRTQCTENFRPAPDPTVDGQTYTWIIKLEPGDGDEIYAAKSRWVLNVLPTPDNNDSLRQNGPTYTPPSWTLTVTATKDAES